MDIARKIAVPLLFVLSTSCATARPPDLKRTLQNGSIELVVQKMQRPWRIVEKKAGYEGIMLVSNEEDSIGLALYPEEKVTPFMAVFGAQIFFTEKYPGSVISAEEKVGQAARATGTVAFPGVPPVQLEVRAWRVPGTKIVAVVTGMVHDAADPGRLQDFEAIIAGVHATAKKK